MLRRRCSHRVRRVSTQDEAGLWKPLGLYWPVSLRALRGWPCPRSRKTAGGLFRFAGGAESGEPDWILASEDSASLYISTSWAFGAVVEISPAAASGKWTERVITRFAGGAGDPSNLVLASDGTLFGLALGTHTGARGKLVRSAARGRFHERIAVRVAPAVTESLALSVCEAGATQRTAWIRAPALNF
jgi:hypothetical protein